MKNSICFIFVLLLCGSFLLLNAQNYEGKSGKNTLIFSGKEQVKYPLNYSGNPYFLHSEPKLGNLSYDNVRYESIHMRLDTYTNDLIVSTPDMLVNTILHPAFFDYAEYEGMLILYNSMAGNRGIPFSGYYISLYKNNIEIIEKKDCNVRQRRMETRIDHSFQQKSRFFILRNGVCLEIKREKDILKLIKEDRKVLKQYIANKGLNFKKDPSSFLLTIVKRYEANML